MAERVDIHRAHPPLDPKKKPFSSGFATVYTLLEKFKQTVGRVERNEIEVAHGSGGDRPWRKRVYTYTHVDTRVDGRMEEGWKGRVSVRWSGRIDRITGRTTWYYEDRCILSIFAMGAWALVHESPRRICMINHWTSRAGTTGSPDRLNERWRGSEGEGERRGSTVVGEMRRRVWRIMSFRPRNPGNLRGMEADHRLARD